MSWALLPGQTIQRGQLHARYGGRPHPRISPSRISPNVFLFVSPDTTASTLDGWTGEHVHFGGEGGADGTDQVLTQGNRAVAEHEDSGRALRLFLQLRVPDTVQYLGQYRLDPTQPPLYVDAPQDARRPWETRRALLFQLLPLNGPPSCLPAAAPAARQQHMRRTAPGIFPSLHLVSSPSHQVADRLLQDYQVYARWKHGAAFTGYRISLPQTITELAVDLFDETRNELIAVRPTSSRPAVRDALGELLDLARCFPRQPQCALLLPAKPAEDLARLLLAQKVSILHPSRAGFVRLEAAP